MSASIFCKWQSSSWKLLLRQENGNFLYPSFFEINQSQPCGEFLLERFVLHAVMCKEVIFQ